MIRTRLIRFAALLALASPLMARAAALDDPLLGDPAAIRVSIGLPPGIALVPGSASLHLTLHNPRSGAEASATDPLAEDPGTGPDRALHLADPATAQLVTLQETLRAWKAEGPVPAGAIAVNFLPCRSDPGASPDAPLRLSIRFSDKGPALALVDGTTTLAAFLHGSGYTVTPCP